MRRNELSSEEGCYFSWIFLEDSHTLMLIRVYVPVEFCSRVFKVTFCIRDVYRKIVGNFVRFLCRRTLSTASGLSNGLQVVGYKRGFIICPHLIRDIRFFHLCNL